MASLAGTRASGRSLRQSTKGTGCWGNDGLTFILRADDGRELARRTIESPPCPAAGA